MVYGYGSETVTESDGNDQRIPVIYVPPKRFPEIGYQDGIYDYFIVREIKYFMNNSDFRLRPLGVYYRSNSTHTMQYTPYADVYIISDEANKNFYYMREQTFHHLFQVINKNGKTRR